MVCSLEVLNIIHNTEMSHVHSQSQNGARPVWHHRFRSNAQENRSIEYHWQPKERRAHVTLKSYLMFKCPVNIMLNSYWLQSPATECLLFHPRAGNLFWLLVYFFDSPFSGRIFKTNKQKNVRVKPHRIHCQIFFCFSPCFSVRVCNNAAF